MKLNTGRIQTKRASPSLVRRKLFRRRVGSFELLENRLLMSASSINGRPFIDLGPSDNVALDQPRVVIEMGNSLNQSIGPEIFNSMLLDTGANTILMFQTAINDLNSSPPPYATNGFFEEIGVGGSSLYDLSIPYRFDFAGESGERQTLLNTKVISDGTRDLSIFGPWGIVGMPAMTQRITSLDFTGWSNPSTLELFMKTDFPSAIPAATGPRYSFQMDNRIEFHPEPHVVPAGLAPPAWADVPFLTAQLKNGDLVAGGNFLYDTGAQVSIMSTNMAKSLGLDTNLDGILDNRDALFARNETIGGIGGLIEVPVFLVDEFHVPTQQGPDLVWTDLQWLILDIVPGIDAIFGFDNMTSGWIEAFSGNGQSGYILKSYLDFRNYEATGIGTAHMDLNPDIFAIVDPNGPGAIVTESGDITSVSESGVTDTYQVALSQAPTANVRVNLVTAIGNQISAVSQANPTNAFLDFTPTNWNVPQTVVVSAINDSAEESLHRSYVKHISSSTDTRYQNVGMPRVIVNVIDNEAAGVMIIPTGGSTDTMEGGFTDTYQLVLTTLPTQPVTITLENVQNQVQARAAVGGTNILTFTAANWNVPQTVLVTATDDALVEGDHKSYINHLIGSTDPKYQEAFALQELIFIRDNDVPPATPPRVSGVRVGSSAWTAAFKEYVDAVDKQGIPVPTGSSAQLNAMPWVNVDRIYVSFTKDVGTSIQASDFVLGNTPGFRANGTQPAPVTITSVQMVNPRLVEIRLSAMLDPTWIDLKILSAGVTDSTGNILDGNWTNGGSNTQSGNGSVTDTTPVNGVVPNDFSFRMAYLPGDANPIQNLVVNSTDAARVISKQNEFYIPNFLPGNVASPGYDPKSDLDGSGIINSFDQFSVLSRQNSFLLTAPGFSQSYIGVTIDHKIDPNQETRIPVVSSVILSDRSTSESRNGFKAMKPNFLAMTNQPQSDVWPIETKQLASQIDEAMGRLDDEIDVESFDICFASLVEG
ncbi:MAG: retropepsin-like aspartic protease [Pirellula sp.]